MDSQSTYKLEFQDPQRKNFLYSAFPADRDVNPKHWDTKLSFWLSEVEKSCAAFNDFSVDLVKLRKRFDVGSGAPLGISVVVSELIQNETLVPIEKYSGGFQDSWIQWASQVSTSSASWVWGKVTGQKGDNKEYILLSLLKEQAELLLAEHNRRSDKGKTEVLPFPVLLRYKLGGTLPDEKTLTLILGYLKQQGKVQLLVNEDGQKIVKFAERGKSKAEKINEDDLRILKLKQTIARLQIEQKHHLDEAESFQQKARNAAKKNREEAKRYLRESKRVGKSVQKREEQLGLLIDQLTRIREVDNQKQVVDALDESSTLLKKILKNDDISLERVEGVVSQTEDTLDSIKELDDVITEGLSHLRLDSEIDVDDLEKELEDLLLPQATAFGDTEHIPVIEKEDDLQLPSVPLTKELENVNKETESKNIALES